MYAAGRRFVMLPLKGDCTSAARRILGPCIGSAPFLESGGDWVSPCWGERFAPGCKSAWAALRGLSGNSTNEAEQGHGDQESVFPGAKIPYTSSLVFTGGPLSPPLPIPCYRTLDAGGTPIDGAHCSDHFDEELAVRIYQTMVKLHTVDVLFYEAQRQGRLSFYLTSFGEEATTVATAAALDAKDVAFLQYREHGVLLWRGFTIRQMADQCYGNKLEPAKGRQMPIHYGASDLNVHTISSTLATQLPHAVGAGFALKARQQPNVAAAYFGDGASSEGDFHAAMNFAAALSIPMVFICRNNGYAISTPVKEQYKGDGVAGRGPCYGMATIRVDGGDPRAVYSATALARKLALENSCPVLIESMAYRSGHHSTSDDSSRYRDDAEMQFWLSRDPLSRFRHFLLSQGWWDQEKDKSLRKNLRDEVVATLDEAQKVPKAPLSDLFSDVYEEMPWHLKEQRDEVLELVRKHPEACPPDIPPL